ncbi:(5-formylfuran-3-yl)methyl phosphate synthase [Pirellulaceae bacterium SH449]
MATTLAPRLQPNESGKNRTVSLLVSVRDLMESELVARSSADWVDVKDPQNGPLGRPQHDLALRVERLISQSPSPKKLSVALGEATESSRSELVEYANSFSENTLFKLAFSGTYGSPAERRPSPDQHESVDSPSPPARTVWDNCRALFVQLSECLGGRGRLIPVYYADASQACSPSWTCILNLCLEAGGDRVLMDTYRKNGKCLTDYHTPDHLQSMIAQASEHGIRVALAGSLRRAEIRTLMSVGADVIGVRGAACKQNNRTDSIDQSSLQDLTALFQSNPVGPRHPN